VQSIWYDFVNAVYQCCMHRKTVRARSTLTSSSASGLVAFFTLSLEDPAPDTPPPPLLLFPAPVLLAGSGQVSVHT
jgi:hypothetical protein